MITGKIATILNESQLLINVGANHGVKPGMHFIVFEEGDEVQDPDTGESLGKFEVVKGELEVGHVQQSISLLETYSVSTAEKTTVLSAKLAEVKPSFGRKTEGEREKLYVKKSDITGAPSANPIAIGDPVRSVE